MENKSGKQTLYVSLQYLVKVACMLLLYHCFKWAKLSLISDSSQTLGVVTRHLLGPCNELKMNNLFFERNISRTDLLKI